jgi:predicted nucleotidyltransferase
MIRKIFNEEKKLNKELEKILKTIKNLQEEIKKEYRAKIIGLFGSYVRGEQRESSDVDIIVRFFEGATLFDFVGLAEFLEEKLNVKVDVVSERALRPELKEQILKEVIAV